MKLWLRIEFALMFVAAPLLIAVLLPATQMFPALFAFTGLGVALLFLTPGFRWGELAQGRANWPWRELALFSLVIAALCLLVILALRPGALFNLALRRPHVLAMIWLLYPFVSALPQELLFRPLFFRRYACILPGQGAALWLNAALFSFAHLMYWSWVVAIMTFVGGLIFGWAYRVRGSFTLAVILHGLAGNILFTIGLGIYFYSGNVVRPF